MLYGYLSTLGGSRTLKYSYEKIGKYFLFLKNSNFPSSTVVPSLCGVRNDHCLVPTGVIPDSLGCWYLGGFCLLLSFLSLRVVIKCL